MSKKKIIYRKVASSRLSRLVAHFHIFRLFLKENFVYVLWRLDKMVQNWIVDRSTTCNFTVLRIQSEDSQMSMDLEIYLYFSLTSRVFLANGSLHQKMGNVVQGWHQNKLLEVMILSWVNFRIWHYLVMCFMVICITYVVGQCWTRNMFWLQPIAIMMKDQ